MTRSPASLPTCSRWGWGCRCCLPWLPWVALGEAGCAGGPWGGREGRGWAKAGQLCPPSQRAGEGPPGCVLGEPAPPGTATGFPRPSARWPQCNSPRNGRRGAGPGVGTGRLEVTGASGGQIGEPGGDCASIYPSVSAGVSPFLGRLGGGRGCGWRGAATSPLPLYSLAPPPRCGWGCSHAAAGQGGKPSGGLAPPSPASWQEVTGRAVSRGLRPVRTEDSQRRGPWEE